MDEVYYNSRSFDMLYPFFLSQDPFLPLGASVLHRPQDDLGHFESRVAESDC
jgi:hypothetical protein